ncbi:uncharacterized protein G2W53_016706 [Senna tora]|uniref:Uncharacterized protein n=1 Tax=Senna tora TaxID=362788 RepID=A0A834TPQ1_9FABA|nr:uncharacterized protein G2W53_016706 [Senna tora]
MSREHNLDNHPDFIPYDMWAGFVDYRLNPRTQEMESGGPVSRGAIFVATHKKRDGSFVNDEAKNICLDSHHTHGASFAARKLRAVLPSPLHNVAKMLCKTETPCLLFGQAGLETEIL